MTDHLKSRLLEDREALLTDPLSVPVAEWVARYALIEALLGGLSVDRCQSAARRLRLILPRNPQFQSMLEILPEYEKIFAIFQTEQIKTKEV